MNREELDRAIEMAPNGKPKMVLLRKAWELADEEKDYNRQMYYRIEYMDESCFYDDEMEIYVIYPELIKLYDERIKEYGEDSYTFRVLWRYKWLLENARDFYQISVPQYEMFWQDAKRRYQQNGYSLRSLYQHRFIFYVYIDKAEADKAYREYTNWQRDSISDCHACEKARDVDYFLELNELGKAISYAVPLIDGELSCEEEPESTKGAFLRYYNQKIIEGDKDYVEPASELCEAVRRSIDRDGIATFHLPDVFMFYALEHPTKALNYYKKNCTFLEEYRNPRAKFWFALATLRFLHNLGDKKTYKMSLKSTFVFYNENDIYDVEMLRKYYRDAALDIANKMDTRNKTTIYTDIFYRFIPMEI